MTQTLEAPNLPARNGNGNSRRPLALAGDTATLKGLLEASKDRIANVLPRHMNAEKLIRVALVAVSRSELLQECTSTSILQCLMTGAQLGLDCSGVLGSAYMVPFWNSKINAREATFIPGYRGLVDLARRSDQIDDIYAHCVYKQDRFELDLGDNPKLVHKPDLQTERNDDDIVGAYMVAFLKGNTRPHIEFVPRCDIEKVRKSSKAAFDRDGRAKGPWKDWFGEMCRKTAIRRGIKYLPMSVELAEALEHDNQLYQHDETRVISASTESGNRADALLNKLTSRPVSENQTFQPDDTALAQAQQDQQSEASQLQDHDFSVTQPIGQTATQPTPPLSESPEENHMGAAAAQKILLKELCEMEWAYFPAAWHKFIEEHSQHKIDRATFDKGLKAMVKSTPLVMDDDAKVKEKVQAKRMAWVEASLEGRINWDKGLVMPAMTPA